MSEPRTLFDKIWQRHLVDTQDDGTCLIYIDRHLVHEVTSPQAFEGLRSAGRAVRRTQATLAVADHNVPTTDRSKGIDDEESRILSECIRRGIREGVFQHVDPEDLAQFISTYLDGVMVRSVILGDFDLTRAVERLRREIWQQLKYQGAGDRPHDATAGVRPNA